MRDLYRRTSHVYGPIQKVPSPDARVTIDDSVVDRHGVPAARITGELHAANVAQAEALQARAVEWLHAAGATRVWTQAITRTLTAGQHQAGTCRMGADPATSVTDPFGRVHGHDSLWVMDASLHVTNGGFNPVLTIYALAIRNAERLVAS